jgi:hypothetical protein
MERVVNDAERHQELKKQLALCENVVQEQHILNVTKTL